MPKFLKPLILVCAAAAAAATFGVGTAQASTCSDALIHDWYVDGRIDNTYEVHCYREALRDIPEDQIVYGTLRQEITTAVDGARASGATDSTGPMGYLLEAIGTTRLPKES